MLGSLLFVHIVGVRVQLQHRKFHAYSRRHGRRVWCCSAAKQKNGLTFDWKQVAPLLDSKEFDVIGVAEGEGKTVIPIADGLDHRVAMPTETVNLLVPPELAGMVLNSEHKCLGATVVGSSSGLLVRVEEDNWGFSDKVQLRCVASQRFRVDRLLHSAPIRFACVELFEDRRSSDINEELEMFVALKEVQKVITDIQKVDKFVNERIHVLSDVSSSLDDVLRFMKHVEVSNEVANTFADDFMSKEELQSFALLRALSLGEQEKLHLFHFDRTVDRLRYIEVELRRGLKAVKQFVVEHYEDSPQEYLE